MMAAALDLDAATRLLDQLEASRQSAGEGLSGDLRSPVPRETAEAFRRLVEDGPQALENDPTLLSAADPGQFQAEQIKSTSNAELIGGADSDLMSERSVDSAEHAGAGQSAGSRADPLEPQLPSPADLIAMQFHMGMHAFETRSLSSIRNQAVSNFEQTLKSSS